MSTWLALDVGDKRIGLAAGSDASGLARPHSVLSRRSKRQDFAVIAGVAAEVGADHLLVGLPYNMDGSEGPQARRVRNYIQELGRQLSLPVTFWDERLSSFAADELLSAQPGSSRRRQPNDAVAAAFILQSFLDHQRQVAGAEGQFDLQLSIFNPH